MTETYDKTLSAKSVLLVILSVAVAFLLRSIWTNPMELGGDAVEKFYFARELLRTGDLELFLQNHHTMRWGVNLPQILITFITGPRYEAYYIQPLLAFSAYLTVILFALREHLNTSQKILLCALLFVDPMSFRHTGQLLTTAPAVFYAVSATYLLSRYESKGIVAVVSSAMLFFCAYGAHATYMSFAAGAFLWLVLFQRALKPALVFAVTLCVLLIVETLLFNFFSGGQLSFGRIEALFFGQHVQSIGAERNIYTWDQLFTRWLMLPKLELGLSLIFLLGGLVYLFKKKRPVVPTFISCSYFVGMFFALFVSFAIVDLDPIQTVQRLLPRYLWPFIPFAIIVDMYILARLTKSRPRAWSFVNLAVALALATTLIAQPEIFDSRGKPIIHIRPKGTFWLADSEYSKFAETFQKGDLVLVGKHRRYLLKIAQFKRPVNKLRWGEEISMANRSDDAKCVVRLGRLPLDLNYYECDTSP